MFRSGFAQARHLLAHALALGLADQGAHGDALLPRIADHHLGQALRQGGLGGVEEGGGDKGAADGASPPLGRSEAWSSGGTGAKGAGSNDSGMDIGEGVTRRERGRGGQLAALSTF